MVLVLRIDEFVKFENAPFVKMLFELENHAIGHHMFQLISLESYLAQFAIDLDSLVFIDFLRSQLGPFNMI